MKSTMKSQAVAFILGLGLALVVADTKECEELPDGKVCPPEGLHIYTDQLHCSKYWECFNGCATHITCSKDWLFDDVNMWCDEPQKVKCGNRDCDNRPCWEDPIHNGTFVCPQADGYFADPENCIKYYHCFNNIVEEHLTCRFTGGQQLCYEPNKVWCDFCANVNCNERPICDQFDQNCKPQSHMQPHFFETPGGHA